MLSTLRSLGVTPDFLDLSPVRAGSRWKGCRVARLLQQLVGGRCGSPPPTATDYPAPRSGRGTRLHGEQFPCIAVSGNRPPGLVNGSVPRRQPELGDEDRIQRGGCGDLRNSRETGGTTRGTLRVASLLVTWNRLGRHPTRAGLIGFLHLRGQTPPAFRPGRRHPGFSHQQLFPALRLRGGRWNPRDSRCHQQESYGPCR